MRIEIRIDGRERLIRFFIFRVSVNVNSIKLVFPSTTIAAHSSLFCHHL